MRNPRDIFTEPSHIDVHTLKNLGPVHEMAGMWEGRRSLDIPPKPLSAPVRQAFGEHTELQPIDPQANGPQLFYGLRYHTHIVKPGEIETYHDQVGYWLWEPATGNLIPTQSTRQRRTVWHANCGADVAIQERDSRGRSFLRQQRSLSRLNTSAARLEACALSMT